MSTVDIVFFVGLGACALMIAYQDFKERLISVWLIGLLSLMNAGITVYHRGFVQVLQNLAFLGAYLLFSYTILLLYFYLKTKRWGGILDHMIGWGDVWLMVGLGLGLDPEIQLFFFTGCFVFAMIVFLFLKENRTVPLAGVMALGYWVWVVFV